MINKHEVCSLFRQQSNSSSPEGVSGSTEALSRPVLFYLHWYLHYISPALCCPLLFLASVIVSVPKKTRVMSLNDYSAWHLSWWKFWKGWSSDILNAPPEANWTLIINDDSMEQAHYFRFLGYTTSNDVNRVNNVMRGGRNRNKKQDERERNSRSYMCVCACVCGVQYFCLLILTVYNV